MDLELALAVVAVQYVTARAVVQPHLVVEVDAEPAVGVDAVVRERVAARQEPLGAAREEPDGAAEKRLGPSEGVLSAPLRRDPPGCQQFNLLWVRPRGSLN